MVEVTGDVMTCGNTVIGKIMPQRTVRKGASFFVTNRGKMNLAQGN
jgi:hypothetical protein